MKSPILYRNEIPFFTEKSDSEFQKDIYERYNSVVVKHSWLHLTDQFWAKYYMQDVLDFARQYYQDMTLNNILEIGCGVGKWIGSIAQAYPNVDCWGMDFSYQMLKRANEFWVLGNDIYIDLSNRGFSNIQTVKGFNLSNLKFGLAKAANLPFADNSQDLVLNSFLLDRLELPKEGLAEMYRVLKPNGKLILVSPLNFHKASHWNTLYPPIKIYQLLIQIGFEILDWNEEMIIQEPLDVRGNEVSWKCLAIVASKKS